MAKIGTQFDKVVKSNIRIMVRILYLFGIFSFGSISCFAQMDTFHLQKFKINYSENVPGDFSYLDSWMYPMGIFKKEDGSFGSDDLCPCNIDRFRDSVGNILPQFYDYFFNYADTTHVPVTSKCTTWIYGRGIILSVDYTIKKDTVDFYSLCWGEEEEGFNLRIIKDSVQSLIKLYPNIYRSKDIYRGTETRDIRNFKAKKLEVIINPSLQAKGIYQLYIDAEYLPDPDTYKEYRRKGFIMFLRGTIYIDTNRKYYYWCGEKWQRDNMK